MKINNLLEFSLKSLSFLLWPIFYWEQKYFIHPTYLKFDQIFLWWTKKNHWTKKQWVWGLVEFTCVLARSSCWKPSTSLLSSTALSWTNEGQRSPPSLVGTLKNTVGSPWGRWASCHSCLWGRWAGLSCRGTLLPSLAQNFPHPPGKQATFYLKGPLCAAVRRAGNSSSKQITYILFSYLYSTWVNKHSDITSTQTFSPPFCFEHEAHFLL